MHEKAAKKALFAAASGLFGRTHGNGIKSTGMARSDPHLLRGLSKFLFSALLPRNCPKIPLLFSRACALKWTQRPDAAKIQRNHRGPDNPFEYTSVDANKCKFPVGCALPRPLFPRKNVLAGPLTLLLERITSCDRPPRDFLQHSRNFWSGVRMPSISVAVPTYRRPGLLSRAIDSVFAQTFTDWEMVISDDESPSGETWNFLQSVARSDARVRPVKNDGLHGASFNRNNALKATHGEWIKILEDDDVLKPNCLDVLNSIVCEHRDVVAISCACEDFVDGRLVRPFLRRDRPLLEQINSSDALLAMYLLDEACWARPSQQMVHRSVIDAGVLFEDPPGISHLHDSWFNARVHARGAALVYNSPLVEWHQGEHESMTSVITADQLNDEFIAFRKLILPLVLKDKKPPNLHTVEGMVMVTQALANLRGKRFGAAFSLMARVWDPRAYWLALRWLLRQYRPRRFSSIARTVILSD
jgi:glycosyltransferase involved in cell wall biosynthesis